MVQQLKAYVTFEVPAENFSDANYTDMDELLRISLDEVAARLGGKVVDLEVK